MTAAENPLGQYRQEIDAVDGELVALLARRKALVAKVGEVKSIHGLPVYVPGREKALISARRAEAQMAGISPDLIEDILRRIMRESYAAEGDTGFKATAPDLAPIVVVGGGGGMGALFVEKFRQSNYTVRILEHDNWPDAPKILAGASLVLISVPINITLEVIEKLAPLLSQDSILADVTSIKAMPLRKMLSKHSGPVLGLHPMFGPATGSLAKQLVVYCHGRGESSYQWLLDQCVIWGASLLEAEPEKHDHMMGTIQAMRHFATYIYGMHLYREGVDIETVLEFSSPIYRLELAMVGRLFAQEPALYADIIFSSVEGGEIAERYHHRFEMELEILRNGDRQSFINRFMEVKRWFGPHAEGFLKESSFMLEKVYEKFGDRPEKPEEKTP